MLTQFGQTFVVNLPQRKDRLERFRASCPLPHTVFPAVDGSKTGVPPWWRQGGGAWGCLMSHARILESCLVGGIDSVLIFEDDAVFCEDFEAKLRKFMAAVPDDWDMIYLGGQHLKDPTRHDDEVLVCRNVNRTHAFAINAKAMKRIYNWVLNAPDYIKHPGQHIDHRLGALTETSTLKVYAPTQWLVGQGEGKSDISGRENPTFFWNSWAHVPKMPMLVVLDYHCGLGNIVAQQMKEMGVHFGHTLRGYTKPQMEDVGLASLCEFYQPFPHTSPTGNFENAAGRLHDWCHMIQQEAANYGGIGGACYPTLCTMQKVFEKGWPNVLAVVVKSCIHKATDRLQARADLKLTHQQAVDVQASLRAGIDEWIKKTDHMIVDVDNPEGLKAWIERARSLTS